MKRIVEYGLSGVFILVLLWVAPARALTLAESVTEALAHNPTLEGERLSRDASYEKIAQARSAFLPSIRLSEQFSRTNNPMWAFGTRLNQQRITSQDFNPDHLNDPDTLNNYATVLSVDFLLYDGSTLYDLKLAGMNAASAALSEEIRSQAVIADTVSAYLMVQLSLEKEQVIEQMRETAATHMKLIQTRYDGGFVAKSDLLRAQVRTADLKQQARQAKSTTDTALCRLNTMMGTGEYRPYDLTTPLVEGDALKGSLDEWVLTARSKRPEVKQSDLLVGMAEKSLAKAKATRHPSLGISGNYEIDSEDFGDTGSNYTVGARVSLPIYTGGRVSARIREAALLLDRAKAMRRATRQQICGQARSAYFNAQSAWERIHVAQAAIGQAEESLRIVKNRYQGGLFTITDLLDAEVLVQQSRTSHLTAVYEYLDAVNRLAQASGTASATSLLEVRKPAP